jgi:predicted alpha/beta superfamily hydrolase
MNRAWEEGRIHYHPRFASSYLSTRRDITVYVPPGYEESGARYPVLYMQDGQNLFDPATAFGGQDWRAHTTADELICAGAISPIVIVGINNAGVRRISEYTPTRDPKLRKGGKAERYAQMLAREVKPFIDREYRTLKPAARTAVGGSSLGALASVTAGLLYPRVFGNLLLMSPSVWWDNRAILHSVETYESRVRPRIWLDIGTAEGDDPGRIVEDTRVLRQLLLSKGWRERETLAYCEAEGAGHNEAAWAMRFAAALRFLFGVERNSRE